MKNEGTFGRNERVEAHVRLPVYLENFVRFKA